MTEDDARDEVQRIVGEEATDRLARLATLVMVENHRQNLIARSTEATIWSRHILDSIQLLRWAGDSHGTWLDIGTGGGFPGLAIAIASRRNMVLAEPRQQRARFLHEMVRIFDLTGTNVIQSRVERLTIGKVMDISARAVAPIGDLFENALGCSSGVTRWLLPRGAGWQSDVDAAKTGWKGMFHVEQSLSDPASAIVIGTKIERR